MELGSTHDDDKTKYLEMRAKKTIYEKSIYNDSEDASSR